MDQVLTVPRVIREGQFVVSRISSSEDPYRYIADYMHQSKEVKREGEW
jgi:hypothetical protein